MEIAHLGSPRKAAEAPFIGAYLLTAALANATWAGWLIGHFVLDFGIAWSCAVANGVALAAGFVSMLFIDDRINRDNAMLMEIAVATIVAVGSIWVFTGDPWYISVFVLAAAGGIWLGLDTDEFHLEPAWQRWMIRLPLGIGTVLGVWVAARAFRLWLRNKESDNLVPNRVG